MRLKRLLETAVMCAFIGAVSSTAFAAKTDSAAWEDPNNKMYVEKIAVPDNAKARAEAPTVSELADKAPKSIILTDPNATKETVGLYQYLAALGKTDYVLYGHQNDAHHKMFLTNSGSNSDTKDVTGSLAGIVGMDALSLTGSELNLTDSEVAKGVTYVDKLADIAIKASKEGAIITLSMHMPNFAEIKDRGKKDGKYDYIGYSPNVFTGNVVQRIVPGGDLNDVYTGYLDLIADFALKLEKAGVPVIYRPLHEQNGYWFYWGAKYCTSQEFVNLYHYTVKYLRDVRNVHNFLYAISPNGPFKTKEEYLDRYPGDRYVDIMGVDTYDDNPPGPAKSDPWFKDFALTLQSVNDAAKLHHKIPALTEVGIRDGGSLAVSNNKDKDWFSEVSKMVGKTDMPYFMVWSNFEREPHNFFAPYMVSKTRGHEMINKFIDYYNEKDSIFADGVTDYSQMPTPVIINK
ncbi:glycoside hydrolase family 26 protein [Pectinatus frisingensis]|uniref:glycoside hydrolase family 26 protein n=1 Tax=Pectinatus frisingensis TaxID=865 RepID=UPI0018C60C4B|nr:glycosyl hydrolase [Pectinatus frisingensis]